MIVNGGQYMTNGHITMCLPYINILRMSSIIFRQKVNASQKMLPRVFIDSGVTARDDDIPAPPDSHDESIARQPNLAQMEALERGTHE